MACWVSYFFLGRLNINFSCSGDKPGMCAVCLDDFIVGEKLRILPCSHGLFALFCSFFSGNNFLEERLKYEILLIFTAVLECCDLWIIRKSNLLMTISRRIEIVISKKWYDIWQLPFNKERYHVWIMWTKVLKSQKWKCVIWSSLLLTTAFELDSYRRHRE